MRGKTKNNNKNRSTPEQKWRESQRRSKEKRSNKPKTREKDD